MKKTALTVLALCPLVVWATFDIATWSSSDGLVIGEHESRTWIPKDDPNCVAAYYMNSDGGNETDRSGEGNTLTQTDGTIPTTNSYPSGYSGTSRDFEKSETEYLAIAEASMSAGLDEATNALSLTAWIWVESSTSDGVIAAQYDNGANERAWRVRLNSSNGFTLNLSSNKTAVTTYNTDNSLVSDAAWTHIAMTYDGAAKQVIWYVDGSAVDTNTVNEPFLADSDDEFQVGCAPDTSYPFDGFIDELSVWNDVLTPAEVSSIKTSGLSGDAGGSD